MKRIVRAARVGLVGAAGALALACCGDRRAAPSGDALEAPGRALARHSFEDAAPGSVPARFEPARTGPGADGDWRVQDAADAPSGQRVVAQMLADRTDDRYPLLLAPGEQPADVAVQVRFQAVSGEVDQAGGLVLRARGPDDYYLVRANALEDNVRFYRIVDGKRRQIAGVDADVSAGTWHTLELRARGERFEVWLDGARLYEARDAVLPGPGRVGLWTKADSVTRFDDLVVSGW